MDGFQYTNTILDFFPHSEGYTKAVMYGNLGGTPSYEFRYVFNFTDHLGNIRLKYAPDPSNNNAVTILEEDHYYPYGLKHKGYSGNHLVFEGVEEPEGPGTGITLTPVNPFLGDSYKYKFGGKEYQDEFDLNSYDFGARNYDPALGRWMNIDPLAEFMWSKSPYVYAFDNPIYYIDPDGMMPFSLGGGSSMGLSDMSMGSGDGPSGDSGGQDPDPQFPDTSGVQELDEVVVVAKKEEKGVDGGVQFWGNDLEDRGHKIGTTQASVEINDFPMGTSGAGGKTKGLMKFIQDMLDLLNWYDSVPAKDKKPKTNESTMETRNKEPVEPPDSFGGDYYSSDGDFRRREYTENKDKNSRNVAIEKAKQGMERNKNFDSVRVRPVYFNRAVNGVRMKDTTVIKK